MTRAWTSYASACAFTFLTIISSSFAWAQPWNYDFGSGTGTHDNNASTSFLPTPPSGNARVRIGTQGGSVELRNPGDTRLGSGSEAVLTAPTGASLNKIQWYGFNAAETFTFQTALNISGGTGDIYFFCGNGSCFSDNVGFSSSQVFAGMKWVRDNSGLSLFVRSGSTWSAVTPAAMHNDSVHILELYANNSATTRNYSHNTQQTLAAYSYDVWIDGVLVIDGQAGAGLPDTLDINGFMFYAAASASNDCRIALDDIIYTNTIAAQPLPVELSAFEARAFEGRVELRWRTETELQNYGFEILRSSTGDEWEAVAFVPGDGDRQTPRWYMWTDSLGVISGLLRYRLRQIDRDGGSNLSPERVVQIPAASEGLLLGVPWPNPARDFVTLSLSATHECDVQLEILTLVGTQVAVLPAMRLLPAGRQDVRLSCARFPRGLHLVIARNAHSTRTRFLMLQ
ncbi:MAG: hypothetical protein KFH87_07590 [Bacteroidetes bacterium]|nr:hypothetical protein [Bacteroidota bacterium]